MLTRMDTIDKIVDSLFAAIATQPFTYRNKTYQPKPLYVSPLLLRGFTCPSHCGGCCFRVTLDYIAGEDMPKDVKPRNIEFNGNTIEIFSDMQAHNPGPKCRYLMADGRCANYPTRPFMCDFELIRVLRGQKRAQLTSKLFGRGWALLRVDGQRGAKCQMISANMASASDAIAKLHRLKQWADHFKLPHLLDQVFDAIAEDNLPITLQPALAEHGLFSKEQH